MKRLFRILRIWAYGKLEYAKKTRRRIITESRKSFVNSIRLLDEREVVCFEKFGDDSVFTLVDKNIK